MILYREKFKEKIRGRCHIIINLNNKDEGITISWKRKAIYYLISTICAYIYYPKLYFVIIASLIAVRLMKKQYRKKIKKDRLRQLDKWIALFFESLANNLDSGHNPYISWENTSKTLLKRLKESGDENNMVASSFCKFLIETVKRRSEGWSIKENLNMLAKNLNHKYFSSFIEHFELGIRQGADLAIMTGNFLNVMNDKRELMEERDAKLYAAKREQTILFIMPFILLACMRSSSMLYVSAGIIDLILRIFCLAIFLIAYKWTESILAYAKVEEII